MTTENYDGTLGRVPSGLFILTVTHKNNTTGLLASWVMQAGFEPPMVTVAVNRTRPVGDWLTAGAKFVLNVVGAEDKTLLKHFGRGFDIAEDAFEGVETTVSAAGLPVLTAAIGHLECEPVGHIDSEDHRIFLARVVGGDLVSEDSPYVHVRKSGARY